METHLKTDSATIIALRMLFIHGDYLSVHSSFHPYAGFLLVTEIFLRAIHYCCSVMVKTLKVLDIL